MNEEILYGFELALLPSVLHGWTGYVPFVPVDKNTPLLTFDNQEFDVRSENG